MSIVLLYTSPSLLCFLFLCLIFLKTRFLSRYDQAFIYLSLF